LRKLLWTPLLVVDEVGYIPFDAQAANLMFSLVSSRYERASLIVTSNKPFSAWGEIFGDETVAAAMIDRSSTTPRSSASRATATGSATATAAAARAPAPPNPDRQRAEPSPRRPPDPLSARRPGARPAEIGDKARDRRSRRRRPAPRNQPESLSRSPPATGLRPVA